MCVVKMITIVEVVFVVSILTMESCVVLTALNVVGTVIVTVGAEVTVTVVIVIININVLGEEEEELYSVGKRQKRNVID